MKKIAFVLFVVCSLTTYSQNIDGVMFKFNNKEEFTNQFKNNTTEKIYNFLITGILSESESKILEEKISKYRGVLSFTIGIENSNGERLATLKLYNYADHWKYYEFLFSKNGINKIEINGTILKPIELNNL